MQEDPKDSIHGSLYVLRRSFFLILALSILVSVIGYGITKKIPGMYEVHFSSMVSMDQKDVTPGFTYDGYYGLSAIDLFSTTLARIADSPETVVAAYKKANIELPTQDAISLVRTIDSEKAAPQLVRITVKNASKQHAERLAAGLLFELQRAVEQYNANLLSSTFHVTFTPSWTSQNLINPIPIAASLFMLVFVGGNMIVVFREAIKRGSS